MKSTAKDSDKVETYELPDGNIITVDDDMSVAQRSCSSKCSLAWRPAESTTCFLLRSMKSDADIRKNLFANVVMYHTFQGIDERMTKELTALAPPTMFSRWCLHQCEGIR